jgi:hypothetical protein
LFELWELANGTLSCHSLVHVLFIVGIMNMPSKSRAIATAEKRSQELFDYLQASNQHLHYVSFVKLSGFRIIIFRYE